MIARKQLKMPVAILPIKQRTSSKLCAYIFSNYKVFAKAIYGKISKKFSPRSTSIGCQLIFLSNINRGAGQLTHIFDEFLQRDDTRKSTGNTST